MLVLDAQQTARALPWLELVDALKAGFTADYTTPLRHHHEFSIPGETAGTLLIMPAWQAGNYLGIKHVMVIPQNHQRGLSAVSASYHLYCAKSGALLAIIDGDTLTHRRTAAASALASCYLSRDDASHLLMVGTGGLARSLIPAHCAVRPITQISIWGRSHTRSTELAGEMRELGYPANVVTDLATSVKQADIISCATLAKEPLILGEWLTAGSHLDLVGAFTPQMRESDDNVMRRARIFVDTREAALVEAGDLTQALQSGAITEQDVQADLFDLCGSNQSARSSEREITVFKSVGTAIEDLAAGVLAYTGNKKDST